ncbi:glycosyltransferase [Danxiaibacter flavus]|uniref:Glycosyltransferase n=1 Tax=Danxiaibacter flavus TaxID=3049108 RepID=A0ABV3ZA42_9BACT|nr:glycosyltransferase [Chitinophagaceae bacterium DXS]
MADRKTFIILTPGFPVNEADTSCLPSIQVFVKNLQKERPLLNIVIISFQYPFIAKKYKWHNIQVIGLGGSNKGKINRLWVWMQVWQTLKTLNRQNHVIGILSLWLGECALIGKKFGRRYGVKHYTWLLGQDAKKNNRYKYLMNTLPEELIAISDAVAKTFYESYGIQIPSVIPIGMDGSLFRTMQSERTIDIMGAGSLIPLKKYDLFIDVVRAVKSKLGSINVVLCGEGPERDHLYELIDQYGLQNDINVAGEVSHGSALLLMQQTKVFLHTSSYEGFSTVCSEALRAGAYVISFCKPMRKDFNHWTIVSSTEEMAEHAIQILKDESLDHSPVCTYSIHDTVREVLNLFEV